MMDINIFIFKINLLLFAMNDIVIEINKRVIKYKVIIDASQYRTAASSYNGSGLRSNPNIGYKAIP